MVRIRILLSLLLWQLRCQIGSDYLQFWHLMTVCVLLYFHICDTGLMIMMATNNVTSSDTIVDITQLQIFNRQNIVFLSPRIYLTEHFYHQ